MTEKQHTREAEGKAQGGSLFDLFDLHLWRGALPEAPVEANPSCWEGREPAEPGDISARLWGSAEQNRN